jgi:hypothetical protein
LSEKPSEHVYKSERIDKPKAEKTNISFSLDSKGRELGKNTLCKEILGRVLDVIIRKGSHSIVRVVIVRLVADVKALDTCIAGSALEVLRQKLALLVEVISSALGRKSVTWTGKKKEEKKIIITRYIERGLDMQSNSPHQLGYPEDLHSTS